MKMEKAADKTKVLEIIVEKMAEKYKELSEVFNSMKIKKI